MSIDAMKQALEALELLARYEDPETRIQVRKRKDGGPIVTMYPHKVATEAADTLRLAIEQAERQQDLAYREAVSLAKAIFKKHFAHEEHYASGRIVWQPLDTTAGVISQIDNMTCRLVAPPQRQPLTEEELEQVFPAIATYHEANKTLYRSIARAIERAHGIGGGE